MDSYSFYSPAFDFIRLDADPVSSELQPEPYRTDFRKDYARLIHSPSFRRLSGKTQLYPGYESDFFRNRLSHSLEVAQIAKSIAIRLNNTEKFPDGSALNLDTDLVEIAALAHDLGHPPFGHQGEHALDQCMLEHGGFEGNAQTLRILSKLEKKFPVEITNSHDFNQSFIENSHQFEDLRVGLNLTYRTLASVLKYNKQIPILTERLAEAGIQKEECFKLHAFKGYYATEDDLVKRIIYHVLRGKALPAETKFKTIECSIMDLADDIAYSTYDLEDGLKGGFFQPLDMIFSNLKVLEKVSKEVSRKLNKDVSVGDIRDIFIDIFDRWLFSNEMETQYREMSEESPVEVFKFFLHNIYKASKQLSEDGYVRTSLSSFLVGKFIRGVKFELNSDFPALSKVYFDDKTRLMVEVVKTYNYEAMILSPRLKIAEYRGKETVKTIFEALSANEEGIHLMPKDFQEIYASFSGQESKRRVICDFIAGMTDRYCIEFYGRLKSENPETIFKPF